MAAAELQEAERGPRMFSEPDVLWRVGVQPQPLSFDTSSVTTMYGMFYVRSSPSPAPNLQSGPPLHAACAAVARRPPPPSPQLAPHRMPSVRLSAERGGVQPAAELRHLRRHNHALHVPGALLPVPCPNICTLPSTLPSANLASVAQRSKIVGRRGCG